MSALRHISPTRGANGDRVNSTALSCHYTKLIFEIDIQYFKLRLPTDKDLKMRRIKVIGISIAATITMLIGAASPASAINPVPFGACG